ncbi:MAG: hypothetical protein ACOH2H_17170 [Cypionkella sp.]
MFTNYPNDRTHPKDFKSEPATGTLPTYEVLPNGKWVSACECCSGDGMLARADTTVRDPSPVAFPTGTRPMPSGRRPQYLMVGFANTWYASTGQVLFVAMLIENRTDYFGGPRLRLQFDKRGQDLPSGTFPWHPNLPLSQRRTEVQGRNWH